MKDKSHHHKIHSHIREGGTTLKTKIKTNFNTSDLNISSETADIIFVNGL